MSLCRSQRFSVLDRDNMAEAAQEAKLQGQAQQLRGASYVVTGDITEFGRKDVGDRQLFGILGRGKEQVAYAKITLNVVNTLTSEVVFSAGGAGDIDYNNVDIFYRAADGNVFREFNTFTQELRFNGTAFDGSYASVVRCTLREGRPLYVGR